MPGAAPLAKVREGVEAYFGQVGRFELEPAEVVALGASQMAWSRGSRRAPPASRR